MSKKEGYQIQNRECMEVNVPLGLVFLEYKFYAINASNLIESRWKRYSALTGSARLPPTAASDSSRYPGDCSRTGSAVHLSATYLRCP